MTPPEIIEKALHGEIITCHDSVFLVHFGKWSESEYVIGYAVEYLENSGSGVISGRKDVCFKHYREQITRKEAISLAGALNNPRTFEEYINMEGHPRPRRRQIPLTEPLIKRLTAEMQTKWKGYEIVGQGKNCVTAIHTYGSNDDSWSLMCDLGGLPSMAFPPMDMVDITAAQASQFMGNPDAMVRYFHAHARKHG